MYSDTVAEHAANPRNPGPLEGATHEGTAGTPGEGPYITIWLRIADETIRAAAFKTFACPSAIGCGSMTTVLMTGRQVERAALLTAEGLLLVLGGLPEAKQYCAALAITALGNALRSPV